MQFLWDWFFNYIFNTMNLTKGFESCFLQLNLHYRPKMKAPPV